MKLSTNPSKRARRKRKRAGDEVVLHAVPGWNLNSTKQMPIKHSSGNYLIEVDVESVYDPDSMDNINQYDAVYLYDKYLTTAFGIKVLSDNVKVKSAVIGCGGGPSGLHDTAIVFEEDRLLICCAGSVFCLSIPLLSLMWRTQADDATCFQIFKHEDRYVIHGELTISMIDRDGHILWQQHGGDIFTTINGRDNFSITDDYIFVTDWENRKYKFDFNGKMIE
jgi:hypothetical protein